MASASALSPRRVPGRISPGKLYHARQSRPSPSSAAGHDSALFRALSALSPETSSGGVNQSVLDPWSAIEARHSPLRESTSGHAVEEELVWTEHALVHSLGCSVRRVYSFAQDDLAIVSVVPCCFFRPEVIKPSRERGTVVDASLNAPSTSREETDMRETFGPFHQHLNGGADPTPKAAKARLKPRRCLMIQHRPLSVKAPDQSLTRLSLIFVQTGENVCLSAPFLMRQAWSADVGVMAQDVQGNLWQLCSVWAAWQLVQGMPMAHELRAVHCLGAWGKKGSDRPAVFGFAFSGQEAIVYHQRQVMREKPNFASIPHHQILARPITDSFILSTHDNLTTIHDQSISTIQNWNSLKQQKRPDRPETAATAAAPFAYTRSQRGLSVSRTELSVGLNRLAIAAAAAAVSNIPANSREAAPSGRKWEWVRVWSTAMSSPFTTQIYQENEKSFNVALLENLRKTVHILKLSRASGLVPALPSISLKQVMPCHSMAALYATQKQYRDLVMLIPNVSKEAHTTNGTSSQNLTLVALTNNDNLLRLDGGFEEITTLEQASGSRIDLSSLRDGVIVAKRVSVALWTSDSLVDTTITTLSEALAEEEGWYIRRAGLRGTWSEFSRMLLNHPRGHDLILPLHLLGQEFLLKSGHVKDCSRIGNLIVTLASGSEQYSDWRDFWQIHMKSYVDSLNAETIPDNSHQYIGFDAQRDCIEVPDIFSHLQKLSAGENSSYPPIIQYSYLKTSQWLCEVFPLVRQPHKALEVMVKHRVSHKEVMELCPGVMIGVKQLLRTCQSSPSMDWQPRAFDLIGRNDCLELHNQDELKFQYPKGTIPKKTFLKTVTPLSELVTMVKTSGDGMTKAALNIDLNEVSQFRFNEDHRLREVSSMLQTSNVLTINSLERADLSDTDLTAENAKLVGDLCERTFAISIGRALYTLDSVNPTSTKAFGIPPLELSVRLLPNNSILSPDTSSLPVDFVEWPDFHNGVAAGLQVTKSSSAVDASWILLNRPSVLTGSFGGFLLGLGLNGHLKALRRDQSFPYLAPKHSLTSTGFLLGLASSNAGTGRSHVADQLIWHVPAFMPIGSAEMDHAPLTQAASLLGLGILYLGTRHRKTAARMLQECHHQKEMREWSEPYTLSAALAYGCVMVGRGTKGDEESLRILNGLILEDVTSPALTLSLGMMYLRSNRQDIVALLEIPASETQLDLISPEKLLFKSIAKHLINFDFIGFTRDWIDSQVPTHLRRKLRKHTNLPESLQLAYFNLIGAACFVIGLKYAGTALEDAHSTLYGLTSMVSKAAGKSSQSFAGKLKRMAARSCLNIILVAISSVMAGTGDIRVLKMLHEAHGQVGISHGTNYGSHVAVHMSMGLLFLGGGRYTLGSSPAAIAAMIVAFFPRYPSQWIDHRAHPQAYRHLWMLAVEPRCLVTRDVESGEAVYVPIKVKLLEDGQPRSAALTSPTLLPDIKSIIGIRIDSPRYWPLVIDFSRGPIDLTYLAIKRRTGHLSYQKDPRGNRSIFSRSSGTSNQPDLEFSASIPLQDLSELASSFASDTAYRQLARRLCDSGPTSIKTASSSYTAAILLECLVEDKSEITWLYISLLLARINLKSNVGIRDLRLGLSLSSGSIVQTSFLKSALQSHSSRLYDAVQTSDGTSWGLYQALWSYLTYADSRPSDELCSWLLLYACPCRSILMEAMILIKAAREESLPDDYEQHKESLEEGIALVLAYSLRLHEKVVSALMTISLK